MWNPRPQENSKTLTLAQLFLSVRWSVFLRRSQSTAVPTGCISVCAFRAQKMILDSNIIDLDVLETMVAWIKLLRGEKATSTPPPQGLLLSAPLCVSSVCSSFLVCLL
jgi:hypothetical protein